MKIKELLSGISIPITNEESDVLDKFNESTIILKSDLDPREQIMANSLVKKDVLSRRKNDEGKIAYRRKIRDE